LSSITGFYAQITKFENNTSNLLNVFVMLARQDDRCGTTIAFHFKDNGEIAVTWYLHRNNFYPFHAIPKRCLHSTVLHRLIYSRHVPLIIVFQTRFVCMSKRFL